MPPAKEAPPARSDGAPGSVHRAQWWIATPGLALPAWSRSAAAPQRLATTLSRSPASPIEATTGSSRSAKSAVTAIQHTVAHRADRVTARHLGRAGLVLPALSPTRRRRAADPPAVAVWAAAPAADAAPLR